MIRRLLLQKRRSLLSTQQAASAEADALRGLRDAEYEETAQVESAHYTLTHLVETQRREVIQVDAALLRLDAGVFGLCIDCGADIPVDRLRALPFALRCEEDASRKEAEARGVGALPSL